MIFDALAEVCAGAWDYLLNIRFVWLSAIFMFLGGGQRVYDAIVFASVSSSVPSSKRYVASNSPYDCLTRFKVRAISSCCMPDHTLIGSLRPERRHF